MFINHRDAQIFALDFGGGPRTLLAHGGWTGSWELWCEPMAQLSRTWRTVAYDHRGTGATVAPAESISFETLVDDLFAVLDALEIPSCVLAAESSGAAVALQAAARHPERFTGLVLVDGLYYRPVQDGPDPFLEGLRASYAATVGAFVDQCVLQSEPESAAIRRWGRQILMRSSQQAAINLLACMDGVDLRPLAAQIVQPTLVIHGDGDAVVPLASSEWLAAQLPGARLHVVGGAGHVPTVTHPREVAAAIDAFFA